MTPYEKNPQLVRQTVLIWTVGWAVIHALLHLTRGKSDAVVEDIVVAIIAGAIVLGGFEVWLRWRRAGGAIAFLILVAAYKARLRRRFTKHGNPLTPPP